MADYISWFATGATILAALITASNLGARITGYGFVVFLAGSVAWLATALMTDQSALLWTNAVLTLLNLFGIWRWLGREAKFDEAGEAALDESRELPGEELFPAKLLGSAAILGRDGEKLGHAVDAMVGSRSGRIAYLVASSGGVAGIAEELRRIDWQHSRFDEETIRVALSARQFQSLEPLAKDSWPGA